MAPWIAMSLSLGGGRQKLDRDWLHPSRTDADRPRCGSGRPNWSAIISMRGTLVSFFIIDDGCLWGKITPPISGPMTFHLAVWRSPRRPSWFVYLMPVLNTHTHTHTHTRRLVFSFCFDFVPKKPLRFFSLLFFLVGRGAFICLFFFLSFVFQFWSRVNGNRDASLGGRLSVRVSRPFLFGCCFFLVFFVRRPHTAVKRKREKEKNGPPQQKKTNKQTKQHKPARHRSEHSDWPTVSTVLSANSVVLSFGRTFLLLLMLLLLLLLLLP